jgi:hypothetical protein
MTKKPTPAPGAVPTPNLDALDPAVLAAIRSEMARKAVAVRWAKKGAREARAAEMRAMWAAVKATQAAEAEPAPKRPRGRPKG